MKDEACSLAAMRALARHPATVNSIRRKLKFRPIKKLQIKIFLITDSISLVFIYNCN